MATISASQESHPPTPHILAHLVTRGEQYVAGLLRELGEDPLRETPERVWKSLSFLTAGYEQDISNVVGNAVFEESYDEMVLVRDIEFYSLCEHHLLPFFGRVHIAYISSGRIVGLSKLPRIGRKRAAGASSITTPIPSSIPLSRHRYSRDSGYSSPFMGVAVRFSGLG